MTAGERLKKWADETASSWADRLLEWTGSVIGKGTEKIVARFEPEGVEASQSILERIKTMPGVPDSVKADLDKMETPTKLWGLIAAIVIVPLILIPMVFSVFRPLGNLLTYAEERLTKSARIDPMSVITAWRRDPAKHQQWFDDLRDLGWSDERIEVLKFATQAYPALADVIRFYAREAFEPDMIARYGLRDELPPYPGTLFEKLGVPAEIAELYWIAHWEHASWMQVVEMLHRGLLTEEQVYDWFRVVEIPPYWRDLLIQTAYTWPTRVDVRRWWDMRTIDETELRRLYSGMGYRGVNLDNYVLWTKVYVAFPDLMARWSNGWITEDDVRSELTALGMPVDRVNEMIQTKIKPSGPARTTAEKDLTKTEIYKGVKQDLISWGEGLELLTDMGYDEDEADYILAVNVGVLEGSPETFAEFKDWTTKYKIAIGKEVKPMTEELKKAASEVVRLTAEVKALEESITEEKRGHIEGEVLPVETTARLDELQVTRNRAISALELAKSEYNRLIAEWRHGSPE